jgi:multiple sugar transport system substrate-binding protein
MVMKPKTLGPRTLALLLLTMTLVAVLSAAPGVGPQATSAAQKQTVTVWVGSWWTSQVPLIMERWTSDHPEITLKIEPLPINGYLDKFIASALAGNPPDVIDLDGTWVSTVAAQGLLQPLDGYTKNLDTKDFVPSIWAASHYRGVLYAIPNRAGALFLIYNKTVFDNAHVPYPSNGWTYTDMLRIARKLTIPGQYGVGIAADASDPSNVMDFLASMIWAHGGDFLNTTNTKAVINSPKSVAGLTFWAELYTKYHVAPSGTPNFSTTRDLLPLFEANKVGMIPGGSNTVDEFSKHPDLRWGGVLLPEKVNRSGGWTMGVPVGAKDITGAQAFLLWFTKPENLGVLMNRTPSRLSVYRTAPWNSPKWALFAEALKDARALPSVANWFSIEMVVISEAQKILVGQLTPQQAADAMAKQIDAILAKK